jgi:hypothetical protein
MQSIFLRGSAIRRHCPNEQRIELTAGNDVAPCH